MADNCNRDVLRCSTPRKRKATSICCIKNRNLRQEDIRYLEQQICNLRNSMSTKPRCQKSTQINKCPAGCRALCDDSSDNEDDCCPKKRYRFVCTRTKCVQTEECPEEDQEEEEECCPTSCKNEEEEDYYDVEDECPKQKKCARKRKRQIKCPEFCPCKPKDPCNKCQKCQKPGRQTNNPYLNFVRDYRRKCCLEGNPAKSMRFLAKKWCELPMECKKKYMVGHCRRRKQPPKVCCKKVRRKKALLWRIFSFWKTRQPRNCKQRRRSRCRKPPACKRRRKC